MIRAQGYKQLFGAPDLSPFDMSPGRAGRNLVSDFGTLGPPGTTRFEVLVWCNQITLNTLQDTQEAPSYSLIARPHVCRIRDVHFSSKYAFFV